MSKILRQIWCSDDGAGAAEFALVLPLFLILLFGVIDGGRFLWQCNLAEKATQVGARAAIVTNVLSDGLKTADYVGQTVNGTKITSGGSIPAAALGVVKCTSASCTCETAPCPSLGTFDTTTFSTVLVARMQQIDPDIKAENVVVRYSGSGLGYASPGSMEISPLVTVTLEGMQFKPITTLLFAQISMPHFATTLTGEDLSGQYSN
jgi:Flp pilus assembly protein TadG